MLKDELTALALKAIARAHDTRERIKNKLNLELVYYYAQSLKDAAKWLIENRLQTERVKSLITKKTRDPRKKVQNLVVKKERKSSIRPAKEIASNRADAILSMLKKDSVVLVKSKDQLLGKKSLAYLVWALGHAERASLKEGISVHDVSALLYKACKIELYPINISRVVHSNEELVRQAGQEKRTKTYLLTPAGEKIFKEKFLA
jgi:hypothetical protein